MEDSEKLKKIVRLSAIQVKANGGISPSLSLEMIGYIRELEAKHRHLKWAEEVIRRGVELMPIEQLNQWTGVRAWQESLDLVMDEKEGDE